MSWRVISTPEFDRWLNRLGKSDQERVIAAKQLLEEMGPAARRPIVGSVKGSRHSNMKELRTGTIRALFAFDPERTAVLLIGGDKRDRWREWYRHAIPKADQLYDRHLGRRKH